MISAVINVMYINGAALFFVLSLDGIKDNPVLYRKSPPVAWVASAIWTIFWPLAAARMAHQYLENKT